MLDKQLDFRKRGAGDIKGYKTLSRMAVVGTAIVKIKSHVDRNGQWSRLIMSRYFKERRNIENQDGGI